MLKKIILFLCFISYLNKRDCNRVFLPSNTSKEIFKQDNYNEEKNKTIFSSQNLNKISNETLNYASNKEQTNKEVDEEHLEKEINLFSNTSTNGSEDKNWADILTFSRFLTIGNLFYEKLDARISIYFIILFSLVVFALILYSITKLLRIERNSIQNFKFSKENWKNEDNILLKGRKFHKPKVNYNFMNAPNVNNSDKISENSDLLSDYDQDQDQEANTLIYENIYQNGSNMNCNFGSIFNSPLSPIKNVDESPEEKLLFVDKELEREIIFQEEPNFEPKTNEESITKKDSKNWRVEKLNFLLQNKLCEETIISRCIIDHDKNMED